MVVVASLGISPCKMIGRAELRNGLYLLQDLLLKSNVASSNLVLLLLMLADMPLTVLYVIFGIGHPSYFAMHHINKVARSLHSCTS
uniref:Uncharacterized protein n=1 Tax=Utricularia reniformis TaxID=192314 RepID=A0A1Y0B442_9LAMI|nr:hypothetical protein AEK19_MT2023 [Utricularia reniformis]ART32182.1 hypothetical protein AEK19_MT2023 [Utricularia reniformis]